MTTEDLHSGMPSGYKLCRPSILAQVAGRAHDCCVVYHSDVNTQLGVYQSTAQCSVHSISQGLIGAQKIFVVMMRLLTFNRVVTSLEQPCRSKPFFNAVIILVIHFVSLGTCCHHLQSLYVLISVSTTVFVIRAFGTVRWSLCIIIFILER